MIIDLQRRIQEAGRIRIGQQVATAGGRTRPAKLGTFRLTSPDQRRIRQAATAFGGTPAEWDAPAGRQWEVVTEADTLDVIVPPADMAFSQHYELWSAGGCQRRCDGRTESLTQQPCLCDPEARECAIHTRLSVLLRDLSGLGVWRIDTSGYYAAVELGGAVQVIQTAAAAGTLLPARLRLEQRSVKRIDAHGKPQTRNFPVPVLDVDITPAQLLGGHTPAALGDSSAPRALDPGSNRDGERQQGSPLTPVPADLPTSPQRSIAEQAAPPAPKPKRANAAPEIPQSGRDRRNTATAPEPDLPADEPDTGSGEPITPQQSKALHATFSSAGLGPDEREQRLRLSSYLIGRKLASSTELSKHEASDLLDALQALNDVRAVLDQLDNDEHAADLADIEHEQASDQPSDPQLFPDNGKESSP